MKIGKLPEQVLVRSVLKQIKHRREDVLVGPSVGQDCAAVEVGADEVLVLSTDPITGTVKDIGSHSVHITVNDLASSGSEPIGIMLTIMLPERTREAQLKRMMADVEETCEVLGIEIIGGHTEITNVVNQPLITVTGVGKIKKSRLLTTEGMRAGQDLVVTKFIGLEGTSILAKEREEQLLEKLSPALVNEAKAFDQYLSVLPEARIANQFGVSAMHDITEGGIFGALWEMAAGASVGLEVDIRSIPIKQETIEVCEYFGLNPYYLMSSGSMLIATDDGEGLVKALETAGIPAGIMGRTNTSKDRILRNREEIRHLDRPQSDELYKVLG